MTESVSIMESVALCHGLQPQITGRAGRHDGTIKVCQ